MIIEENKLFQQILPIHMLKSSKELSPIFLFIALIILFTATGKNEINFADCHYRNGIYLYQGHPVSGSVRKLTKDGRLAARFLFHKGVKHGEQTIYCYDGRTKYATLKYHFGHKIKTSYKQPLNKQQNR